MRKVIAVAAASAGAVVLLAANANPALAQPTVNAAWPMCASPSATYCILAATRDGEAVDAANNGPYEGGVLVPWAMFTDTNTVAWGMKWSLDETSLPGSVGGSILVSYPGVAASVSRCARGLNSHQTCPCEPTSLPPTSANFRPHPHLVSSP